MISEELRKYIDMVNEEYNDDQLFEMANVTAKRHGIENVVIWVGAAPKQHGLRVKVSNIPNKMDMNNNFVIMMPSLDYDPSQVADWISPKIMKKILLALAVSALFGSVQAQTAPTAPTQASAPAITTQSTTRFAAGVTASLNAATTNIIYLEQTGNAPTVSINQDGNSNRAGANASGTINSMILNGNSQVVTLDQTGNNNLINTLKITGNAANVYLQQYGNSNTADVSCGLTTSCSATGGGNAAALDFRFSGNSNTLAYTGDGPALQAAVYATGNGNTVNIQQTSTAGQQALINLTNSDNNTINLTQTSASLSSLVLSQNGSGGTAFTISQTGTYSNVANISATAAGGSFNIIQRSR